MQLPHSDLNMPTPWLSISFNPPFIVPFKYKQQNNEFKKYINLKLRGNKKIKVSEWLKNATIIRMATGRW